MRVLLLAVAVTAQVGLSSEGTGYVPAEIPEPYLTFGAPDAGSGWPERNPFRYVRSEDCRKQINHFMRELTNNAPWAMRMFESTSKYPFGLTSGNNYQFGDYDTCISTRSPDGGTRGKYCLADVEAIPRPGKYPSYYSYRDDFSLEHDPHSSFVQLLRVSDDPSKKPRNVIHSGICVPDKCTSEDVEDALNDFVAELAGSYGYNVTVTVPPRSCSTAGGKGYGTGGKIVWGIILVLLKIVILSSVWDILRQDPTKTPENSLLLLAESFSLRRNLTKLTTRGTSGDFDAFHGLKALSMLLIILGHRCMSSFGGPIFNAGFLEEGYRSFPTILLLNGILIVDTFFLIGGFLTFVALHHEYVKKGDVSAIRVCLHRWLRITPDYMLMVFFYGYVLENLGSGPVWSIKVGREAERCRDNWWANLFFINNYVNPHQLCMFQSWYVACDFHYIIISPVIVKLVSKMGRKGLLFLLGLIIISSMGVFAITYYNEYDGVMRIYHKTFDDLASSTFFSEMYIKSHNRIIPYLSGMAAAHIYLTLKESKTKPSLATLWISSLTAVALGLTSICLAWVFYIPGREYNPLENALYASMHRVFWSISIGWIAVTTAMKCYGVIQPILSGRAYIPISKLTFGAYLTHGAVQMYTTASLRSPEYMTFSKLFWMTCGDVMLSFLFAFLLHILVEAPVKGIKQLLFSKKAAV